MFPSNGFPAGVRRAVPTVLRAVRRRMLLRLIAAAVSADARERERLRDDHELVPRTAAA